MINIIKEQIEIDEKLKRRLEIMCDYALTIGDFDKDVFREFKLEKLSKYDEISLIDAIKHAENKYSNFRINDNLNETING